MRILQYVRSLLPDLEKRRILENLQVIKEEVSGVTIPLYEQASDVFKNNQFANSMVKKFDTDMQKELPNFRTNHIHTTLKALRYSSETIESLINVISRSKHSVYLRDGMTVLMANQLQFSEVTTMVAGYARRWLLHLYSLESVHNYTANDYLKSNEFLRETAWFGKNKQNFFSGVGILSKKPKDVEVAFKEIPDIAIDPDSNIDPAITAGASKVDPLQFGLLPTFMNPIYQIRMRYTSWQLKKHTLMIEERQQLELKLLLLKQSKTDENDPKLEKQIEYNENRIEKLRYEIAKIEGKEDE